MKQLIDLLKATPIERMEGNSQVRIIDVTADSRAVETGSLFFCLRGEHVDGHSFANMAAENGAAAIIAEKKIDVASDVTIIYVADTRKAMEDIVPYFFDYPSKKMRMIALTGTNGKTTTTHIISHILHHVGYKTGVIGTVHALIGDKEIPTHNTTPDVTDLQRILCQMLKENVTHVCMEVSSHSLVMGRVIGCEFDTAVFTNLTEDHLDYHKTMDNYAKAKSILFKMVSGKDQIKDGKSAWINSDDPYAAVMSNAISDPDFCQVSTYGFNGNPDLKASDVHFSGKSSSFKIQLGEKRYVIKTKLIGRFNVYNVMAAIGAALSEGVDIKDIQAALSDFVSVAGRFELIEEGQSFSVVVDYAHTPDGLEKILTTAKEIAKGRLITCFGCGGDRDKLKRPIMGRIAANYSDVVVITSDNPRTEDPEEIIREIAAGVQDISQHKSNLLYKTVTDRRAAIQYALSIAHNQDIVLIAGKGHEDYQILKDKTVHFDDREEVRKALRG